MPCWLVVLVQVQMQQVIYVKVDLGGKVSRECSRHWLSCMRLEWIVPTNLGSTTLLLVVTQCTAHQ